MIYLAMLETQVERDTFSLLYEKYKYLMLKVTHDVLKDYQMAEDAMHDAFIKLVANRKLLKNRDVDSVQTKRLLITIARNSAIDLYRKREKQMSREELLEDYEEYAGMLSFEPEPRDDTVLQAIANLPFKYREVFALKYSNQLENREIAKLLSITEETICQRISRGKQMLREALEASGGII